jgi:MFS family permease
MGWGRPEVIWGLVLGSCLLFLFAFIETRVAEPMFNLVLFRTRAFAAGAITALLSSVARGGMQFMLIIWLQGIWLPLHGYNFSDTPLWAGIFLLPLTAGFITAGPLSGFLSDRYGARPFATTGMILFAVSFLGLLLLPVNFPYWQFAVLCVINGIGSGMFNSPNTAAIMSSVPPKQRGQASGMRATFMNSGQAISIGVFFSLLITGLHATLPRTLSSGLQAQGVPASVAEHVAHLPPVSSVFAAFLGFNPIQSLLSPTGVLSQLPPDRVATLLGKRFFPDLISRPFHHGLVVVFTAAAIMAAVAAIVSALRGSQYYHGEDNQADPEPIQEDARDAGDARSRT